MPLERDSSLLPEGELITEFDTNGDYVTGADIEIDYVPYYKRIAEAQERIATAQEQIAVDVKRLRDLADHPDGPGIRTISPYGWLGNVILYQLYIQQAEILQGEEVSDSQKQEALNKFNEVLSDLLSNFSPTVGGFD